MSSPLPAPTEAVVVLAVSTPVVRSCTEDAGTQVRSGAGSQVAVEEGTLPIFGSGDQPAPGPRGWSRPSPVIAVTSGTESGEAQWQSDVDGAIAFLWGRGVEEGKAVGLHLRVTPAARGEAPVYINNA